MKFIKDLIHASPYVGVFSTVTEKLALVPRDLPEPKLVQYRDILEVELIPCSIAGSSLLGVLSAGAQDKILVSGLATDAEVTRLNDMGVQVLVIPGTHALGNLLALNDLGGVCSPLFTEQEINRIKSFLGIELVNMTIGGTELVGASCRATNNGFIVNPHITAQEFAVLEKIFQVHGMKTTANYGDRFVSNAVVGNSHGAIIGMPTTTHEMIRIDDALRK